VSDQGVLQTAKNTYFDERAFFKKNLTDIVSIPFDRFSPVFGKYK
jgi:hypothetical protein